MMETNQYFGAERVGVVEYIALEVFYWSTIVHKFLKNKKWRHFPRSLKHMWCRQMNDLQKLLI